MKQTGLTILFVTLFGMCFAQSPSQTIRGKVIDAQNNQSIIGASITLIDLAIGTTTDTSGNFRLDATAVGRHQLRVAYVGKEVVILPVLLESGKELVLEIQLKDSQTGLDTLLVKAPRIEAFSKLSTQTISIEETFRLPATFYDPARQVALYPGVANFNNQANAISVRGNSPNANQWRLEGVEIVNPNHTPNAGTFNDRITQTAGGVNILSAQLLDYSQFFTSNYNASFNNALGGILDMKLRKGNNENREFIGQIGLLGIDVAAEGPISQNTGSSYLANYRYSTIGLLSDMGVDVGDEEISFTDFSLNLSFPTQNAGDFTLFATLGSSKNIFETERDQSVWEEDKDRFDIKFDSRTAILGATHQIQLNEQLNWKTTLAYSELQSDRTADLIDSIFQARRVQDDAITQRKLSLHTRFLANLTARSYLRFGLTATQNDYSILATDELNKRNVIGEGMGVLLQPYLMWNSSLTQDLDIQAGLTYNYFTFNETQSLEPRLALNLSTGRNSNLTLAYGLYSQLQSPLLYFIQADGRIPNENLDFTKSHQISLGYDLQLNSSTSFHTEVYYQSLFDVPVSATRSSSFSALNLLESYSAEPLANEGIGRNIGLEIGLQKVLLKEFYYLLNVSIFDSKYEGSDGIERDTRFNGNYITNATAGKEWQWERKERQMILGINLNATVLGGFRETPIDLAASQAAGVTIFVEEEAYSINQQDYFKMDFRIYYKRNKAKLNTTLALDIQNLTNQQNIAFNYFDALQGEILTRNQLGLIPILTWRAEF